jgi:hypothetical protein
VTPKQEAVFWSILFIAAIFEVGGDALIRIGEKEKGLWPIILGSLALVSYGVVINLLSGPEWIGKWIKIDLYRRIGIQASFSIQLGVYVAMFALVSVFGDWLLGKLRVPTFENNSVPLSTVIGLGIIWVGAMVIRYF